MKALSTNRTKAIFALSVAVLTGCEVVAGIKEITLSGGPDTGEDATAPVAGDDASANGPEAASGGEAADGVAANPDGADGTGAGPAGPGDGAGSPPGDARADGAVGVDANGGLDSGNSGRPMDGGLGPEGAADVGSDVAAPADAGGGVDSAAPADAGSGATDSGFLLPDGAPAVTEMIDNMESQTGITAAINGRGGFWFVYDDGTDGGTLAPPVGSPGPNLIAAITPPRGTSNFAAHVQGMGFAVYAGIGFDMADMGSTKQLYDATAYQGFRFWARSSTGPIVVRFSVPDVNTSSTGKVCTACGDNFGVNLTLTNGWTQFVVYYTQLAQQGFGHPNGSDPGGPTALAASQVYGCQFQVTNQTATMPFDIWVDDIDFIRN